MKLKNIIVALLIGASLHSCDYLDIVPDDTPILADALKNEQTAENFVFACYSFIPNYLTSVRTSVGAQLRKLSDLPTGPLLGSPL